MPDAVSMVSEPERVSPWARRGAWAALLALALVALVAVLVPAWLIQPFRAQTQGGLELSFALRSWSPWVTLAAAVLSVALVVWLWGRSRRWWMRAMLPVVLVPVFVAAWFARQNHFEWMFNPLASAAYARAGEAQFVADDDMVLAVERNSEAVAYPIRQMAYHHLVADTVGGVPLVSTY